jgi:hypothetical protein
MRFNLSLKNVADAISWARFRSFNGLASFRNEQHALSLSLAKTRRYLARKSTARPTDQAALIAPVLDTATHLSLDKDCPKTCSIHPPTAGMIIAFPEVRGGSGGAPPQRLSQNLWL